MQFDLFERSTLNIVVIVTDGTSVGTLAHYRTASADATGLPSLR